MGGALSDGGNLIEWLRDTLRLPDPEETEKLLSEMEPDSHGLTFLPCSPGNVDRDGPTGPTGPSPGSR